MLHRHAYRRGSSRRGCWMPSSTKSWWVPKMSHSLAYPPGSPSSHASLGWRKRGGYSNQLGHRLGPHASEGPMSSFPACSAHLDYHTKCSGSVCTLSLRHAAGSVCSGSMSHGRFRVWLVGNATLVLTGRVVSALTGAQSVTSVLLALGFKLIMLQSGSACPRLFARCTRAS